MSETVISTTYHRGAGLRYDLPKACIDEMRRQHTIRNAICALYRRIDRAVQVYKAMGGDGKLARKHFTAKWGNPREYRTFVALRRKLGAGSATTSELVRSYRIANERMIKDRMDGKPAEFRPKPWRGEGMLYRQIQGPDSAGGVPIEDAEAGKGPLRIERRGRHALFHVTVEANRLSIPVPNYYRDGKNRIPAGAVVTGVKVMREVVGTKPRVSVSVSYQIPAPKAATGMPIGIRLGWESLGGHWTDDTGRRRFVPGEVRVARIMAPMPLTPPPRDVARVVRHVIDPTSPSGSYVDIVLPAEWSALVERGHHVQALRDDLRDIIKPLVVAAIKTDPSLDIGVTAAKVVSWRSQKQFDRLARVWPVGYVLDEQVHRDLMERLLDISQHPKEDDEAYRARVERRRAKLAPLSTLALWRLRDRHLLFHMQENEQVYARRNDAYRKIAAWLCDQANEIVLDAPRVAEVVRRSDEDTYEARAGRVLARFASPGEFRKALENAARLRGVSVTSIDAEGDGQ